MPAFFTSGATVTTPSSVTVVVTPPELPVETSPEDMEV
jgi:hypothetical protein